MLKDLWSELLKTAGPFMSTTAAALLAWLALKDWRVAVGIVGVSVLVLAFFGTAFVLGLQTLPSDPVRAVRLMNWSTHQYWATATLGTVIVIVLAVNLVPDGSASAIDKEAFGAFVAGVTAFLTSVVTATSGDKAEAALSGRVEEAFKERYTRRPADGSSDPSVHYFEPSSRGERLVHAHAAVGVTGWGRRARHIRAEKLAEELKAKSSDDELTSTG